MGEDAQSLRLCEVGLPLSFYFKPTGELFFRLSQSANKEAVFFLLWCNCTLTDVELAHNPYKYFSHFFCVPIIGHRRGAKCLNKLMLLGAVQDSVMRNGRFAQR